MVTPPGISPASSAETLCCEAGEPQELWQGRLFALRTCRTLCRLGMAQTLCWRYMGWGITLWVKILKVPDDGMGDHIPYIYIYIYIYRYIDIPIVLTVEHMGTGQLSRPGGHRMMLLTRGESTCPTMLAASKYKDIWPVRLLANTSPSGNIPGIPWISQTIWEYPKISPNIRSSAEACQDSVGQRGASTVENDPWSTSLQWIPEPGTAWPRGTAFNGDGGTWAEPRWF